MFKGIILLFFWISVIRIQAQQIHFESNTLVSTKSGFPDNFISFKQEKNNTYFLTLGDYLSGNIEIISIQSDSHKFLSRVISLDKELKYNNSLGADPIIDFDVRDSLFFILTQKRIIGYLTDQSFSFFKKAIELRIDQVFSGNSIAAKSKFSKINFCKDEKTLVLSRHFINSLGDEKVCLVKFSVINVDPNTISMKMLNYYFSGKTSYANDAMSLSSGVIHYAMSPRGIHAIVKNGFIPCVTFLGSNFNEIGKVYLNLFDTTENRMAVDKVDLASKRYIAKNNSANLSNLMNALDSCFYIHSVSFINETTLFVQIQNPTSFTMYQSYIVTLDSFFGLHDIKQIIEFKIDGIASDTMTTTNFPIWFSNLRYITENNRIYVLKTKTQEINLSKSLVKDFFTRKSPYENNYHYLIEYKYNTEY
jgi:hypothetical protein